MNLKTLQTRLADLESKTKTPVFSLAQARVVFPEDKDQVLRNSLGRHTRAGYLEKVTTGIWFNRFSAYRSVPVLPMVVALLRPYDFNYVSLETILSEESIISQQMFGYLTVMTTGKKNTFRTPYGTIEFITTRRDPRELLRDTIPMSGLPLRRATIRRAWGDLKRVGRNVGMVDKEALDQALVTTNRYRDFATT
jgi:hypothetical protein